MDGDERRGQHFPRAEKVGNISFGITRRTSITTAIIFENRKISFESRIIKIEPAGISHYPAVARQARWRHTVESVAALLDRSQDVARITNPQEVPRFIFRQNFINPTHRLIHIFFIERATNAETVELFTANKPCACFAQILIATTLHDAKKGYPMNRAGEVFFMIWGLFPKI